MRVYVIRRLLLAMVTVFLVSITVFLMVRLIPGNIIDAITDQEGGGALQPGLHRRGPGPLDRAAGHVDPDR